MNGHAWARSSIAAATVVLLLGGCGRSTLDLFVGPEFDAGLDADLPDGGFDPDAGAVDGGFDPDAGAVDGGWVDGGPFDGGLDGGGFDGGGFDGGPTDGGPTDGGPTDGGPADGGPVDAGGDAGGSDAGSDAAMECRDSDECDDGDECTVDTCVLESGTCFHAIRDGDGDGYLDALCGGDDCDDSRRSVNPGATEQCRNGRDDNCDGLPDCADPTCAERQICSVCFSFEFCGFGFDFDCDGWVDCDDPECASGPLCLGTASTLDPNGARAPARPQARR